MNQWVNELKAKGIKGIKGFNSLEAPKDWKAQKKDNSPVLDTKV
jgi:hypothetical protein